MCKIVQFITCKYIIIIIIITNLAIKFQLFRDTYKYVLIVVVSVVTFQECIVTIAYHKRKVYFDF
jgi:hypothetical protein